MSRATTSVRVFGAYLVVLGAALIVAPNAVLAPFGAVDLAGALWIAPGLRKG